MTDNENEYSVRTTRISRDGDATERVEGYLHHRYALLAVVSGVAVALRSF